MTREEFRETCITHLNALINRLPEDDSGHITKHPDYVVDFSREGIPEPVRSSIGDLVDFTIIRESVIIHISVPVFSIKPR